jgi:hypothetical protein
MLGCDEVERLLSDYEDGALPLPKRIAVRFHLMMCRGCRSLERSLRDTIGVLHAMRDEPVEEPDGGEPTE